MSDNFSHMKNGIREMLVASNYGVRDVSVEGMDFFMAVNLPEQLEKTLKSTRYEICQE